MYTKTIIFIIILTVIAYVIYSTRAKLRAFDTYKLVISPLEKIEYRTQPPHSQQKILVFNSFSYKNNILPEYAEYAIKINKRYCDKYGYDYNLISHDAQELPPYWLRVKDAYNLLHETSYDVIVYLDLDAVFHDFSKPLTGILANDYCFYIGKDPGDLFATNEINNLVNSGCFIVKNNAWSKKFMRQWLYACVGDDDELTGVCKYDWEYKNKKWKCEDCVWAGLKYEQGMLANLYISNVQNAQKYVCILDESVLSNQDHLRKSTVLHLMGSSDKKRLDIFKQLYEQPA